MVSNVFVVGWLSEFVFRVCDGQFAWRSWFCTDTLEVCLMTVSKSPRCPCLLEGSVCVGVENGIRKGPPKTDAFCVVSVFRCSWSFDMSHGEWTFRLAPRSVAKPRTSSNLQLKVDAVSVRRDWCGVKNKWQGRNPNLRCGIGVVLLNQEVCVWRGCLGWSLFTEQRDRRCCYIVYTGRTSLRMACGGSRIGDCVCFAKSSSTGDCFMFAQR